MIYKYMRWSMKQGAICIYSGDGHGKSPAALGEAVLTAAAGGSVVIIQFLKGKGLKDTEFIHRLEPEIKIFRFEKSDVNFDELSEDKKQEEILNIKNGLNYAKKVLSTGECDLLILDEVLGLIDNRIITVGDLEEILSQKLEDTRIILTGITMTDEVCMLADDVSRIETHKFKRW